MTMHRPLLTAFVFACFALALPAQGPRTAAIVGTVTDSVRSTPLSEAIVHATRVDRESGVVLIAISDVRGRFRFDGLEPGRYALTFESAFLDSLEFGGPAPQVTVEAGGTGRVAMAIPSGATLRARACPGVEFLSKTGALLGVVTDADLERPLAGAEVIVAWRETVYDSATRSVNDDDHLSRTRTNEAGQYRLCGVPTGTWLVVQVQHANHAGAGLRVAVSDAVGVHVRNLSFTVGGARTLASAADDSVLSKPLSGKAALTGTIRDERGKPVEGAQVNVLGTITASRSDERGIFSLAGLPPGTHDVEVRQVGFRIERHAVDLRNGVTLRHDVRLDRIVMLDSVAVIANRARYSEFEGHRKWAVDGKFLGEDDIERLQPRNTTDVLMTVPGFTVSGQGPDARVYSARGGATGLCPTVIVVDGMELREINTLPTALLGAMAFYPGITGAPQKFKSPCGTIMIWTKR